jgi:6-phosphogluconolactonase
MLKPVIHTFDTKNSLFNAVAKELVLDIRQKASALKDFRLALSGGRTPEELHATLADPQWSRQIPWKKVLFFWGDERLVPQDHKASNYRMAKNTLLDRIGAPEENVFRIKGELEHSEAAAAYEEQIGSTPMDLILLGIGEDGHTASIFPSTPNIVDEQKRVIATTAPSDPQNRVSISMRTIQEARRVFLIATGPSKAKILAKVKSEIRSGDLTLPASILHHNGIRIEWFLDEEAARELR